MIKRTMIVLAGLWLAVASCSSDSEEDLLPPPTPPSGCDTAQVAFAATITPLLGTYGCTNCHSGTAPSGNINLSSYSGVKAKVDDGRLLGAITHADGFRPMPQGGNKMSDCDINKFRAWINRGALNN
ncbi:MAG: hypothetical protein EOO02_05700 [Chitinophagaceae bacterium]|nr:MAG: hypothetical protein EOO02_05700 [Chitinophagaceae bacterium]